MKVELKLVIWWRKPKVNIWVRYHYCENWLESFKMRSQMLKDGKDELDILVRRIDQDEPR